MGRARQDGYRLDSARSAPSPTSTPTSTHGHSTTPHNSQNARQTRRRPSRNRRAKPSGCRNPQVRKGIGACIFVLGIPCLIAGLIFTIVSSADEDDNEKGRKYPPSFPVAGPVLMVTAVLCFTIGILLHNIAILVAIRDCLNLSEPDSFCRRHFPRLSRWLRPDPTEARNRAALNNLQTAPARSAMRKARNPDLLAMETEVFGEGQGHHHGHHPHHKRKRGVTFSNSDDPDFGHGHRLDSSASETERASLQSDTGAGSTNGHSPSSSLLSLRHCKIRPKDDVFWTDSSGAGVGVAGGGGDNNASGVGVGVGGGDDGVGEGAGHPDASGANGARGEEPGGEGEGGVASGRVTLTDIDEENTSDMAA